MPIENEMSKEEFIKEQKRLEREKWEIEFAQQLDGEGWYYEREYRFHPVRRWRTDFVIVRKGYPLAARGHVAEGYKRNHVILVEIEGGTYTQGRHTRGAGFAKDCEKYNTAASMGWRVFRFTAEMVKDGSAIKFLKEEVWK